ncbi:MAG: hypothetical protein LBJ00_16270 [Planctomycetaceae bacterium]|jgi:hypothetical protein|nr:hypothetical protein [Planctomycetaceae bacterium]
MKKLIVIRICPIFLELVILLSFCGQFIVAQMPYPNSPPYSPPAAKPTIQPNLSLPKLPNSTALSSPTSQPNGNTNPIQNYPPENIPIPAKEPNKRTITEREKHDAIVLFNPNSGHSVVLPGGWSIDVLEDFAKFLMRNENTSTPNFSINNIIAKGTLVNSKVETTIQLNISTNTDKTIKIPLGLKEGVLPPATNKNDNKQESKLSYKYSGKSNFSISVDPTDGQFVAIISPIAPTTKPVPNENTPQEPTAVNSQNISTKIINETVIPPTRSLSVIYPATPVATIPLPTINVIGEHHEITLNLWFPISKLADGSSKLAVSFPHAISSQFILTIPSPNITAATQAPLLDFSQIDNGKSTQFTILGLRPDFDITWRKKNIEAIEPRPILEIKDADIRVQLDPQFISYDATLPVRSLQNTFDKFQIRLPKDTTLDIESSEKFAENSGYSVRLLSAEERNTINKQKNRTNNETNDQPKTDQTAIAEIQLPQKTLGPVNIRLIAARRWQTVPSSAVASDWNDIEGFDVLGAQRQYGTLSIAIPDGMRPNWRSVRGINRVDLAPATTRDGIAAQFRFSLQPFLLRGQIITPQVRTNIKPEYQVRVEKGVLSMTMRLACTASWAQIHSLNIQLFDWQWSGEITPVNTINIAGIEHTADGVLNIPLANVPEDDFEIELKLNRKFVPDELPMTNKSQPERKILSLRFPQPQASWVEPSIAAIVPSDNVDLTPVIDVEDAKMPRTTGLTRINRRTSRTNIELPARQREPLIYQSDSPSPIFVTEIEFHKQQLETDIHTDVRLLEQKEQITETISYEVLYEPVDRINLAIPRVLDTHGTGEYGGIQVFIGNTFLRLRDAATENNIEQNQNDYVKKFIMLPEAMIGKFDLGIKYSIPPVNVAEDLSESVLIPSVKPLNVTINSHKVHLITPAGVNAELREESKSQWKNSGTISPVAVQQNDIKQNNFNENNHEKFLGINSAKTSEIPTTQPQVSSQLRRTAVFESTFYNPKSQISEDIVPENIDPNRLLLLISASDRDIFGITIVERAWIQTWLSDSVRVDHAVYQVNSSRDTITILVPNKTTQTKITIKKNGIKIPVELNGSLITIPLQESEKGQLNTIELWYQLSGIFRNKIQHAQFALPQFNDNVLIRREYWQLMLSPNKFVLFSPTGWVPEHKYNYNGLLTRQKPAFTMSDIGITEDSVDEVLISENTSQFLFSSISSPELTSLVLADRPVIALISSSIALLAGLILVYFPKTRYVGSILGLAVFLPMILFYQPASGLLFLQTASVGIILALAAGYVYRLCYSEKQWILPTKNTNEPELYSVIIDESSNRTREHNNSKSATIGK